MTRIAVIGHVGDAQEAASRAAPYGAAVLSSLVPLDAQLGLPRPRVS